MNKKKNKKSGGKDVSAMPKKLPDALFATVKKDYRRLLIYANSVISALINNESFSQYTVLVFNPNGCLFTIADNEASREWAKTHGISEGMVWDDSVIGKNIFSKGKAAGFPVSMKAEETESPLLSDSDYYIAPISPTKDSFQGAVVIAAPHNYYDKSILALTICIASAISLQFFWFQGYQGNIDSISNSGIIIIDKSRGENRILLINKAFKELVNFKHNLYYYSKLENLIPRTSDNARFWDIVDKKAVVNDQMIDINVDGKISHIHISSSLFHDEMLLNDGITITISSQNRINKMVANYSGNIARLTFNDIIGSTPEMQSVISRGKMGARSDRNILLLGESGVGKDILAQAIHNESSRSDKPYVAVNCGAFSKELIASELFGYEEGAFTGAKRGGATGKLELAADGTLFLDEIGDMPLDLQALLLRVLDNRAFRKVGGNTPIPFQARVIAATNKDLYEKINKRLFRQDLFYRLSIIQIHIPPLRERKEDIPFLARHFLDNICIRTGRSPVTIDSDAEKILIDYPWKGNVRELQNMFEGITSLYSNSVITKELILKYLEDNGSQAYSVPMPVPAFPVEPSEKDKIKKALEMHRNNRTKAASYLGMSRSTLYRRMVEYNML